MWSHNADQGSDSVALETQRRLCSWTRCEEMVDLLVKGMRIASTERALPYHLQSGQGTTFSSKTWNVPVEGEMKLGMGFNHKPGFVSTHIIFWEAVIAGQSLVVHNEE